MKIGQLADAERLLTEHSGKRKSDHEALALLAQIVLMQQDFPRAESLLMQALRSNRKRADYHALLAEMLATTGRHREAIARYDQSLKVQSGYDAAIAGKAEVYLRMGNPAKSLEVVSRGPDTPVTAVPRARALLRENRLTEAIDLTRLHLPALKARGDVQRGLWFVLGQACERAARFDEAFDAYTSANALSACGWTPEVDRQRHSVLKEAFSAEALPTLPKTDCKDNRPIFIVGLPRCGSTLTEQIIDAHPDAHGVGEVETLHNIVISMQSKLGTRLPWPDLLQEINEVSLASIGQIYLNELTKLAPKARRVVDKNLGNFLHIGLIALLFPKARIIHCTRDSMDLGLSCWAMKFSPGTYPWTSDLYSIGQACTLTTSLMEYWKGVVDIPILEVQYESLVADLDGGVRRVLDFCGLDFDERCLRYWQNTRTVLTLSSDQVRQPIYTSSVGRHAAWGDRLADLRRGLTATTLP
jgi:tetratricopeptide (TPR) repeat protein